MGVFTFNPHNCYYPHSVDEGIEVQGGLRETQAGPRSNWITDGARFLNPKPMAFASVLIM